jgi:serine/threonine protein kinase
VTTEIENERSARTGPDPETEAVRRLFRRACTRPAKERAAWVRANAASDAMAEEVLSLLAHLEDTARDAVPADPLLGRTLDGWTLLEPVGEGGSGRVYLAERDNARGAFKLLHAKHSGSEGKAGHRVSIERSALERLSHPAIVRLLDHGTVEIDGTARDYLVTEFVEDAEPLLEGAMREGLTLEQRVELLAEIADAVGHAHARGVIHRDLKAGNIVIDGEGRPRILDFGIARLESETGADRDARAGSRATLAPEQVDPQRGQVTARTDVYALGVIGFRLVTGEAPYDVGSTLASAAQAILHVPPLDAAVACPGIAPGVRRTFTRAMHKSPRQRFRDAGEFAAAIRSRRSSRAIVRPFAALAACIAGTAALVFTYSHSNFPPDSPTIATPRRTPSGEDDMNRKDLASIVTATASTAFAVADVPTVYPSHVITVPGAPTTAQVTLCGDDIFYVRPDRSVRILRQTAAGNWTDDALPGQVPPSGTNTPMVFGKGNYLSVVEGTAAVGGDRVDLFVRNAAGAWVFTQTITAPTSGTFAYLTSVDWSGDRFIAGDRNADSYRGAGYVFEREASGQWRQAGKLQGALATPFYTEVSRVAIEGDLAVVCHWLNPCGYSAPSGRMHVFRREATGTWQEEAAIRPSWATCGDQFGNAGYLAHGRALNLWAPTIGGVKHQFSRVGSVWTQLPDFTIPGADPDTALAERTSFGMFMISQPTGMAWALRKDGQSFQAMAKLVPQTLLSQSGVAIHIGASDTKMVTRMRVATDTYAVLVYDLTPLLDCDNDGVSNADEIAAGAPDCDSNGIPDSCEGSGEYVSPAKAPFGFGQNLSYAFTSLPPASQDVTLTVEAKADLGGVSEFVTVKADGATLATLFGIDGQDCPATPQVRTITIPAAQFNGFLADGSVTIELVPSSLVSVKECPSSTARVRLTYPEQIVDCDGDGQSDACQIAADPGLDKDGDGTIDGCNYAKGDFDLSDTIDGGDLAYLLALWGATNPPVGDLNGDAVVSAPDLGVLLANWGPITP